MTKQQKEFNITKQVRLEFEKNKNTDNLHHLLSVLDYSEVSKKEYIIYEKEEGIEYRRQHYMREEETLAQNFIDCLPFNAYKSYVKLNWLDIQFKEGYPVVRVALYNENFELLNYIGKLGIENILSNNLKFEELAQYKKTYLNPILNLENTLTNRINKSKNFLNNYHDLFRNGLVQYKIVTEAISKKMNYNTKTIIDSWLFSGHDYSDDYLRSDNTQRIKNILSNIAERPEAVNFTDDVMKQIQQAKEGNLLISINGKNKKEKIDITSLVAKSEIISSALWHNNQDFIDKLQKALSLSDDFIYEQINLTLQKSIEKHKEIYYLDSFLSKMNDNLIGNFIINYHDKHKDIIFNDLPLLALCNDEKILNHVIDNSNLNNFFMKIKDIDISYQDCVTIYHVVNHYMKENLPDITINKKPLILILGEKLQELGYKPEFNNWESLSKNIKNNIFPLIQDFYYNDKREHLTIPNGIDEWFNKFHLNRTLTESLLKVQPKIKI